MRNTKRIIAFALAFSTFVLGVPSADYSGFFNSMIASAEGPLRYTNDNGTFVYEIVDPASFKGENCASDDSGIKIIGYEGDNRFVTIPETIEDIPVIAVSRISCYSSVNGEWEYIQENSDFFNVISVTLPDTVQYFQSEGPLMQICGHKNGYGKEIASNLNIAFNEIPYSYQEYLSYEENEDGIRITGIDFSYPVDNFIIPASIDGKVVTEFRMSEQYELNDGYVSNDIKRSLTFQNTGIEISDDFFYVIEDNIKTIYGYPGSTAQIMAYNKHINYVPINDGIDYTGFEFIKYRDHAEVTINSNSKELVIPDVWHGLPVEVLSIHSYATKLESLTIPNSIHEFSDTEYLDCINYKYCNLRNVYGEGPFAQSFVSYWNQNSGSETPKLSLQPIQHDDDYDDFWYDIYDYDNEEEPYIIIHGINDSNSTNIEIPESIDSIPVKKLDLYLSDENNLNSLTIPDCIEEINISQIEKLDNCCIYANFGSYGITFAKDHNISYRYIGLPEEAYYRYRIVTPANNHSYNYSDEVPSVNSDSYVCIYDFYGNFKELSIPSTMYDLSVKQIEMDDEFRFNEVTIPETVDICWFYNTPKLIRGFKGSYAEIYAKERGIAFAPIEYLPDGVCYVLYEDHAEIISWPYIPGTSINIPEYIEGKKVTKIRSGAFYCENDYMSSERVEIIIPDSISEVEDDFIDRINYNEENIHYYNLTIKGTTGSYAEQFATEHEIQFEVIYTPETSDIIFEGYNKNEDYYVIHAIRTEGPSEPNIVFPDTLEGYPVRELDIYFDYYPVSLSIPESVQNIDFRFYYPSYSGDSCSLSTSDNLSRFITEIIGYVGSYAQRYALEKGIKFVPINEDNYNTSYLRITDYINYDSNNNPLVNVECLDNVINAVIPEMVNEKSIGQVSFKESNILKSITVLGDNTGICLRNDNDGFESWYPVLETIRGHKGSAAEEYAERCGYNFIDIPENGSYQRELTFDNYSANNSYESILINCDISAVDVVIPKSIESGDRMLKVTSIDPNAFKGCTALKTIAIPKSINQIPESVFSDCINLQKIYGAKGSVAEEYALKNKISFIADLDSPRYIGYSLEYDYNYEPPLVEENYYSEQDNNENKEEYYAKILAYDPEAESIVIPQTIDGYEVKEIGAAFNEWTNSESIEIPEHIEYVDADAFRYSFISSVTLPGNMESIPYLYGINNLTVLNPDAVFREYYDTYPYHYYTGYFGSTAFEYAKEHNNHFKAILDEDDIPPEYLSYEIVNHDHREIVGDKGENGEYYYHDYYEFTDIYAMITDVDPTVSEVVIPETIKGLPVTLFTGDSLSNKTYKRLVFNNKNTLIEWNNNYGAAETFSHLREIYGRLNDNESDYDPLEGQTLRYYSVMAFTRAANIEFVDIDSDDPFYYPENGEFRFLRNYADNSITLNVYSYEGTSFEVSSSMYYLPITRVYIYSETLNELILPETVTELSLSGCPNIEKVIIPNAECQINLGSDTVPEFHAPLSSTAARLALENRADFYDLDGTKCTYPEYIDFKIEEDNIISIYGYDKEIKDVIIPETIYGFPVTSIYKSAFTYYSYPEYNYNEPNAVVDDEEEFINGPETIIIPQTVVYIEENAICDKTIIYGYPGSAAEEYAYEYGIEFIDLELVNHNWDSMEWHWENFDDEGIVTVGLKSKEDPDFIRSIKASIRLTESSDPDCINEGSLTYTAKIVINGTVYEDTRTEKINPYGHSYSIYDNDWNWSDDYSECYAVVTCNECDETTSIAATVIHTTQTDTCTADGYEEYKAVIIIDGKEYSDIQTVLIPASGHTNGDISWIWSSDRKSCEVIRTCEKCKETQRFTASVTHDYLDPTCTDEGHDNYIAEVMIDGQLKTQTNRLTLEKTAHNLVVNRWIWSSDNTSCDAELMCSVCREVIGTVMAEIKPDALSSSCESDGRDYYFAEVTIGDNTYRSEERGSIIPATGHSYGELSWKWSDDRTSCSVQRICSVCGKNESYTANVTHDYLAPKCNSKGHDNYIATVTIDGEALQDTNAKTLDETPHNLTVQNWIWSSDYSSCEADVVCTDCNTVIETVQAVIRHETMSSTCTTEGYDNYYARVIVDDEQNFDDEIINILPALGHDYYVAKWNWSNDHSECTLDLRCKNCDEEFNNLNAEISITVPKEATYDENGIIRYTAECRYDNTTFSTTDELELLMLERTDISAAKVVLSDTSFDYDGEEKTVDVLSVKVNGATLTEGTDYVVTGNTNTESGEYILSITGIGAYKGSVTRYWRIVKRFWVSYTVNGNKKTYIYSENAFCSVIADEVEGKIFSHWKMAENDTILSYNKMYIFRVVSNMELEAVYADDGEEIIRKPVVAITNVKGQENKIYYEVTRDIPDDYTVILNGVLFSKEASFDNYDITYLDENLVFLDNEGNIADGVSVYASSINTNKGYYSCYVDMSENTDQRVVIRGYVVVENSDGDTEIYYSAVTALSYNQITGN